MNYFADADRKANEIEASGGVPLRRLHQSVIAVREAAIARGISDRGRLDAISRVVVNTAASGSFQLGLEDTFDARAALEELTHGPDTAWILVQEEARASTTTSVEEHQRIAGSLPPAERMTYARKHKLM